jgi:hypothetical protein
MASPDDVEAVREAICTQLPESAHIGAQLEAWGWDVRAVGERCVPIRSQGRLVGLVL